jgi:hypothetical protein
VSSVLDPFWYSGSRPGQDGWALTLGERQYRWLEQTLATSRAAFKLVFIHNLVGGLDGQMRGGIEAAPFFEWGGRYADGSSGFSRMRPGWGQPIHALLVRQGVSAVFHGHDHLYARQELDGIAYQEVPQPSAPLLCRHRPEQLGPHPRHRLSAACRGPVRPGLAALGGNGREAQRAGGRRLVARAALTAAGPPSVPN